MTYELAKQLKETGFPPTPDHMWVKPEHIGEWITAETYYVRDRGPFGEHDEETPAPTLSELIDACGDRFYSVGHGMGHTMSKRWYAATWPLTKLYAGETSDEAVAKLYLAINGN